MMGCCSCGGNSCSGSSGKEVKKIKKTAKETQAELQKKIENMKDIT